jgi:membrane-bound lytic murein transglycosylase B
MPVRLKFILLCSCLWATLSCAADTYESNPAAQALVDELVKEEGFDRASLERVFASAERQESILEAIARPAEKTKPWYEYRKIFLTKKREQKGLEFLAEHRETLARAEQTYGVPREIIVAIIGVETLYGKITGSYRVIDALSTLAFDYPKRSPFFTKELKNYLVLTRDQGFDPLALKGSYAGAMGYGQFMPSSYRQGEPVVFAADASEDTSAELFVRTRKDLKPVRTVGEFIEAGVVPREDVDPEEMATAMKFELEKGYEYWLGLHNFYVITRYNHSAMYAMSVYQLSQRLADRVSE